MCSSFIDFGQNYGLEKGGEIERADVACLLRFCLPLCVCECVCVHADLLDVIFEMQNIINLFSISLRKKERKSKSIEEKVKGTKVVRMGSHPD